MERVRLWIIERLGGHTGGYRDLDEALEAVRDMSLAQKHRWLTVAVKRMFNTVGEDDVLKVSTNGQWLFEGRPMRDTERSLLKAEAQQLETTTLWKVLQKELQYQANKRMFVTSASEMDLVAGKLLVWYIDVIKSTMKRIAGAGKEK